MTASWAAFLDWMRANQIGDVTALVGLGITIIGFIVTIINVVKSKNAAQSAREAAESLNQSIILLNSVIDFSSAISTLREIKRSHRAGHWHLLPDRYAAIREVLIKLRSSGIELPEDHQEAFQAAIVNLSSMEDAVEKHIHSAKPVDAPRFNRMVAADTDKLIEIFEVLKSKKVGASNVAR